MANVNSATVGIGSVLPAGVIANGTLFLKIDGVNDGLYVFYNSTWLKVGKVTEVEPMAFNLPINPSPNLTTAPVNYGAQNITFGGNF